VIQMSLCHIFFSVFYLFPSHFPDNSNFIFDFEGSVYSFKVRLPLIELLHDHGRVKKVVVILVIIYNVVILASY